MKITLKSTKRKIHLASDLYTMFNKKANIKVRNQMHNIVGEELDFLGHNVYKILWEIRKDLNIT